MNNWSLVDHLLSPGCISVLVTSRLLMSFVLLTPVPVPRRADTNILLVILLQHIFTLHSLSPLVNINNTKFTELCPPLWPLYGQVFFVRFEIQFTASWCTLSYRDVIFVKWISRKWSTRI